MSKETLPEVVEPEIEVIPSIQLNQSRIDAMIQFAEQSDRFGKALDKNREFALKRAWNGDFVQHGDKVNVTGPGAERILSAYAQMGVPISFLNWEYHKDTGTDKYGEWFTWWYSAEVNIGGFKSKIEGRAGSRDKFFGFEHDAWKDPADIREADIRMAAWRCVFKEAAKVALGLRSIPADQVEALGLDPRKIKKVEFGKKGETKQQAAAPGTPVLIVEVAAFQGKEQKDAAGNVTKKAYVRYTITDDSKAQYSTFDKGVAELARKLKDEKAKALISYTIHAQYGNQVTEIQRAPVVEQEPQDPAEGG